VAYYVLNRLLRFSSTGQFIEEIADAEDPFGWDGLYDVVVDPGNNLSIVEWFGHRVTTVDQQGTFLRSIGSSGFQPGQFNFSRGLTYDAAGRLVVADFSNKRIQVFEDATLVQALGTAMDGPFGTPYAVAADASGGVYVTDWGMSRIHMLVDPDLVPAPEVVRKPRLS